MTTRAYILIEAKVNRSRDVAEALKSLDSVQSADVVTGAYDIVVVVEVVDLEALGHIVMDCVGSTDGIERTMTCVVSLAEVPQPLVSASAD